MRSVEGKTAENKGRKAATRDAVAEMAGVAPSTVSNVMNGKRYVSEAVRTKVMDAVARLGYTPNMVARSLATKQSRHIGLILDDLTNPHFAELAQGAQFTANKAGYILTIYPAPSELGQVVSEIRSQKFTGIIIDSNAQEGLERYIEESDLGDTVVVRLNGDFSRCDAAIFYEYSEAAITLMDELHRAGHRDIGFIYGLGIEGGGVFPDARLESYLSYCRSVFGGVVQELVVAGDPPYPTDDATGYLLAKRLLGRGVHFTALMVVNDYMTLGVLRALSEAGLSVPQDVSVASFDDSFFAKIANPPLTSIGVDSRKMGSTLVETLLGLSAVPRGERKKTTLRVRMALSRRASIGPAPSSPGGRA